MKKSSTKWSGTMVKLFLLFYLFTFLPFSVVAQQQGCRRGTPRSQGLALRRGAAGGQPKQVGGDFYHGERHQLTVLVEFNDRAFKGDEAATVTQWNKIFNTVNLTEYPFKGSVHDYFLAQSYGDFSVFFDLVYVKVSGNAAKYRSIGDYDENSQYLVEDIMELLKQNPDIDWSLYDWNGDGFINQLLIIYAGHGMNDYSGDNLIWPHQWWMSDHRKDYYKSGGWDGTYCDPIPVTYGDKQYKVDCYCALAELTRNNDYGSFGTICHEYTHCFGFPDFYFGRYSYVYGWDLMDAGNYNGNGYQPAGYSAHERWFMGWLTPTELKWTTTITNMPALANEGRAYLLRNDGHENEYYIIENRQQTDWDASLPGRGILVFHIDYDPSIWTSTVEPPNHIAYTDEETGISYPARQRYVLFRANDGTSQSFWAYPYLSINNSLTNISSPAATLWNANSDGTYFMNKPLTQMTVSNGLASFTLTAGPAAIDNVSAAKGSYELLYRQGSLSIVRLPNGEVKKVMMKQ